VLLATNGHKYTRIAVLDSRSFASIRGLKFSVDLRFGLRRPEAFSIGTSVPI
jgi:hypothetical protein